MAKLHTTMENGKGKIVSSTNNTVARTMVETYDLRITTILLPNGEYTIIIEDRKMLESAEQHTDPTRRNVAMSKAVLRIIDGKYPELERFFLTLITESGKV